jgi:hypothetical protein
LGRNCVAALLTHGIDAHSPLVGSGGRGRRALLVSVIQQVLVLGLIDGQTLSVPTLGLALPTGLTRLTLLLLPLGRVLALALALVLAFGSVALRIVRIAVLVLLPWLVLLPHVELLVVDVTV